MTRHEIVAMFAERQDAINRRDVDFIVSQHAEDCEQISPMAGGTVHGREAIRKLYETWFSGFPDLIWTNDEPLVDGDRVTQMTTHSAPIRVVSWGCPRPAKRFACRWSGCSP